jgi:hypothetical protein
MGAAPDWMEVWAWRVQRARSARRCFMTLLSGLGCKAQVGLVDGDDGRETVDFGAQGEDLVLELEEDFQVGGSVGTRGGGGEVEDGVAGEGGDAAHSVPGATDFGGGIFGAREAEADHPLLFVEDGHKGEREVGGAD